VLSFKWFRKSETSCSKRICSINRFCKELDGIEQLEKWDGALFWKWNKNYSTLMMRF
jgi:hypothetical protein